MQPSQEHPVAILGAGLAGLTAASYLRRHNVPFILYEAGKQIAGLAQSFHDQQGFSYDFGAHFITNRLAAALGLSALCRKVPRYSETVWLRGRTYSYPFGLLRNPRYLLSAVAERLPFRGSLPPTTASEWYRSRYGKALADEVAIPLTEAWSGVAGEQLAPSVGDSIPGSIAETLFLKVMSRFTGRTIAIGYSREVAASPHVWHVYPHGGLGTLCQHLAHDLADTVKLESPVEAIYVESGRVVAVKARGQEQPVCAVISTAPCHILSRLIRGSDALGYLGKFRYRPMVFVNIRLEGRRLLPDVVLWTPEKRFPFFRLTETPVSMPWLAPAGKTLITVDIGCQVNDNIWTMPDDQLGNYCLAHLQTLIPTIHKRYLGCRVLRTPIAYPVYLRDYEQDRLRFAQGTDIEGLISIGRNGEFLHIFMEDVYWRSLKKTRALLHSLHHQGVSS